MSTSVDNRVVEMDFKNKQFESGIKTTLDSLSKLKDALIFDGAGKSLELLGKGIKSLDFSAINNAAEKIGQQFTVWGQLGMQSVERIAQSIHDKLYGLIKGFSFDNLATGFNKFEEKTRSVQTIMSATGMGVEEVNEQLAKLNWFTDETSYNLTDMTANIAKFTSNQIPLADSVDAMQGIAVWCSEAGQGANEASRAMYNLSQALGVGSVKLMDWRSIENANMATAAFKQVVLDTAVSVGTLTKVNDELFKTSAGNEVSIKNFTDALKDEWFSADVLMASLQTYGSFSTRLKTVMDELGGDFTTSTFIKAIDQYKAGSEEWINTLEISQDQVEQYIPYLEELGDAQYDIGRKAFKAAQEAKTWSDVMDATKDAVSTGWMNTWEMIFGNYEEAKVFFTDLANELWDVFAGGAEQRNDVLKAWKDAGGRDMLFDYDEGAFWNMWRAMTTILDSIKEAWHHVFGELASKDLLSLTKDFQNWTKSLQPSEETLEWFEKTFKNIFHIADAVGGLLKDIGTLAIQAFKGFNSGLNLDSTWESFRNGFLSLRRGIEALRPSEEAMSTLKLAFYELGAAAKNVVTPIVNFFGRVFGKFKNLAKTTNVFETLSSTIYSLSLRIRNFTEGLKPAKGTTERFARAVQYIFQSIMGGVEFIKNVAIKAVNAFMKVFTSNDAGKGLKDFAHNIALFFKGILAFVNNVKSSNEVLTTVENIFVNIFRVVKNLATIMYQVFNALFQFLFEDVDALDIATVLGGVLKVIEAITGAVADLTEALIPSEDHLEMIKNFLQGIIDISVTVIGVLYNIGKAVFSAFGFGEDNEGESALTTLGDKFWGFFGKIGTALSDFSKKVQEFDIRTWFTGITTSIKDFFASVTENETVANILQTMGLALDPFRLAFQAIGEWFASEDFQNLKTGIADFFSGVWESIKSFGASAWSGTINGLSIALQVLGGSFVVFWEVLKSGFGVISEFSSAIIDYIKEPIDEIKSYIVPIMKIITASINGFFQSFDNAENVDTTGFTRVVGVVSTVLSPFRAIFDGIAAVFRYFIDNLGPSLVSIFVIAGSALGTFVKTLKDAYASGGVQKVFEVIKGMFGLLSSFFGMVFLKRLSGGTKQLDDFIKVITEGAKKLIDALSGILDGFKSVLKSFAMDLNAKALLKIAGAVGILIGSIVGMALLIQYGGMGEALLKATGMVTAVIGSIIGMLAILSPATKNMQNSLFSIEKFNVKKSSGPFEQFAKFILALSIGILIIAGAFAIIADAIKDCPDDYGFVMAFIAGIMILAAFITERLGKQSSKYKRSTKLDDMAALIVGLGAAVLLIAFALKALNGIALVEMLKGMVIVGLIMVALVAVAKQMDKLQKPAKMNGVISMAIAIGIIAGVIYLLAKVDPARALPAAIEIGIIMLALGQVFKHIGGKDTSAARYLAAGLAFQAMALALLTMTAVIRILGAMQPEQAIQGAVAMLAILGMMTIALKVLEKEGGGAALAGLGILLIAAALNLLLVPLLIMGTMPLEVIGKGLLFIVGILASIAIAAIAMRGSEATLYGLAAAILALGVSSVLIGVGLALAGAAIMIFVLALPLLGEALIDTLLIIINAIPDLVDALLVALDGLTAGIVGIVGAVIDGILQACKVWVPIIITTFADMIIDSISSLYENRERIDQAVEQFMILVQMIVDKVAEYLPDIMTTLSDAIVGSIAYLFEALANIDDATMENSMAKLGSLVGGMFSMMIITGEVALAAELLPGIATNVAEFFTTMQPVLKDFTGIPTSTITNIKNFAEAILFLTGAEFIDALNTDLFGGDNESNYISKMAGQLKSFGQGMKDFADALGEDYPSEMVESASNAAATIAALYMALPREGGALQEMFGTVKSLGEEGFGGELTGLGQGLRDFADAICPNGQEFPVAAVEAATNAALCITALYDNMPREGGWWQSVVGELKGFDEFGTELQGLAVGLVGFAAGASAFNSIDVSEEDIQKLVTVATGITDLYDNMPREGGWWQAIAGEVKSLSTFGEDAAALADGLVQFAEKASAINDTGVSIIEMEMLALVAKTIAGIYNDMPKQDGVMQWFFGETMSLEEYGKELAALGDGLAQFAKSVKGIAKMMTEEDAHSAISAAEGLAGLYEYMPSVNGVWQMIAGQKKSLGSFGAELGLLGMGLRAFAAAIGPKDGEQIDWNNVEHAGAAAKSLADVYSVLPREDGWWQKIIGEAGDMKKFGEGLGPLGKGLSEFASSIGSEFDTSAPENAAKVGEMLGIVANLVPAEGGLVDEIFGKGETLAEFGSDLSQFGGYLGSFGRQVMEGMTSERWEGVKSAADALVAIMAASLLNINEDSLLAQMLGKKDNMKNLGAELTTFGESITDFGESISSISDEDITRISSMASSLESLIGLKLDTSGGAWSWLTSETTLEAFATGLTTLGNSIQGFALMLSGEAGKGGIDGALLEDAITKAERIGTLMETLGSTDEGAIERFGSSLITFAQNDFNGFIEAFSGEDSMSRIEMAIKAVLQKVGSVIEAETTNNGVRSTSSVKLKGNLILKDILAGINDLDTDRKTDINTSVASILSALDTAINDPITGAHITGAHLLTGFINGFSDSSAITRVTASATTVANTALRTMRTTLEIKSPSRKAYEIGKYLDEGLANGILGYSRVVEASASTISDDTLYGLQNSFKTITDILNSDEEYEPIITPVLDLSQLRQGAGAIDNLLGNRAVITRDIEENLNLSKARKANENRDILRTIAELRSDFGSLVDAVGGMDLTMDGGVVVGQISHRMDRALNQISVHRGRGN